jgi:YEATS domain-containing protein 4
MAESFTRSILYGSSACALKKPESDFTHRWKIYVRGFNGEDISDFVKKVQFRLHESFAQPTRGKAGPRKWSLETD